MWIGIVFDCPELSDHQDLAKLLLLLYAPLQSGGKNRRKIVQVDITSMISITGAIIWDFFEEDMEFASYTEQYKMLAETLAGIITPARKYYSPQQVVDVIQSLTGSLRSKVIILNGSLTVHRTSRVTDLMANSVSGGIFAVSSLC